MVFALGSKTSNVQVREAGKRQPSRKTKTANVLRKFTSYDIWSSSETFSVIKSNATFADLLKKEKTFPRTYVSGIPEEENGRRQMHAMALSDPIHWQFAQTDHSVDDTVLEYIDSDDEGLESV